jgi:hypothetical protein
VGGTKKAILGHFSHFPFLNGGNVLRARRPIFGHISHLPMGSETAAGIMPNKKA